MNRRIDQGRSPRALLISLIIHLCSAIVLTIVLYRQEQKPFEDAIGVEFVNEKALTKLPRKRLKPPTPKRLLMPRQIHSSTPNRPQTIKMEASANPINETLRPSAQPLLHSATAKQLNPQDVLPDITTAAEQLNSREVRIAKEVSTRFQPSEGEGIESFRQRVAGEGSGGLHMLESTGTADIGIVGDRSGSRGTGGDASITGDSPFANALRRIADHIIATRQTDKIDVVFVLDTSASMQDNIQEVAENLYSMTDAYDQINLEYYLGMARFSVVEEGQRVKIRSLVPDVGLIRQRMRTLRISGDEHALDALVDTLNYIEFHGDADKYLVLITDEPATTALRKENALEEMREKVIDTCKLKALHVNVLGHTEAFQKRLAEETGGLWQEIPGGIVQSASLPASRASNEKLLYSFRRIATDIRRGSGTFTMGLEFQQDFDGEGNLISKGILKAFKNNGYPLSEWATISIQEGGNRWLIEDKPHTYTVVKRGDELYVYAGAYEKRFFPASRQATTEPMADIVIMLDYSRSMGGKAQAIMLGISTLIGQLNVLPIDYRIGLIRFAEAKDAIRSIDGTEITQMPISEALIKRLMENPFGGDEHLIDAIAAGLPQVHFRPEASRFILVLTDEPSTGSSPPEQAIETCLSLGIRAYVIGVPDDGSDFQSTLVHQTDGLAFTMPNYLSKSYPYQ